MATPRTNVGEQTARRQQRERRQSFVEHALNLRNDNPDPFETYDTHEIARLMLAAGMLNHDNVKLEMAERMVQLSRRELDPNFEVAVGRTRVSRTIAVTPRTRELATAVLGDLSAKTVMRDGRPLGEWTFGEFRREFKGMATIIGQFTDIGDDELVGDYLK